MEVVTNQPAVGSYEIDEVFFIKFLIFSRLIVFIKMQRRKILLFMDNRKRYLVLLPIDLWNKNR